MLTLQSCSGKYQDTHCNFCSALVVSGLSGVCLSVPVSQDMYFAPRCFYFTSILYWGLAKAIYDSLIPVNT